MRQTTAHSNRHNYIHWWHDVLPFSFLPQGDEPLAILPSWRARGRYRDRRWRDYS